MLLIAVLAIATVSATVLLHAVGTDWWVGRLRKRSRTASQVVKRSAVLAILVQTALVLILLHVVEIFIWALTFRLMPRSGLADFGEAVYFSFVTFTTLGYGDITLQGPERMLTGIESLNGVLLIGWSTALSFAVIQRVWAE